MKRNQSQLQVERGKRQQKQREGWRQQEKETDRMKVEQEQLKQQNQQLLDLLEQRSDGRPDGHPGQVLRPWTPPATPSSSSNRGGSSHGGRRPFSTEEEQEMEQGLFPEIENARGRGRAAARVDRPSTRERGLSSSSSSSRPTREGTSKEEKEIIGGGVTEEKKADVAHSAGDGLSQEVKGKTHMEGVWERPGTSPVKAGPMRHLMSYSHVEEIRPMTSPVRSRRIPRKVSPVMVKKRKKTKEETANQPFYRGLFGIKGSKKKISSTLGGLKTSRPRSSKKTLQIKGSFTHVEVKIPRRRK